MPQGPYAIPPRQGQSQLIFPVTGSNAPPEDSSSPSSEDGSSAFPSTRSVAWDSEVSEGGAESVSEDGVDNDACVIVEFGLATDASVKTRKSKMGN